MCLGSKSRMSTPPGISIVMMRPQGSSSIGDLKATPLSRSSATVASMSSHQNEILVARLVGRMDGGLGHPYPEDQPASAAVDEWQPQLVLEKVAGLFRLGREEQAVHTLYHDSPPSARPLWPVSAR